MQIELSDSAAIELRKMLKASMVGIERGITELEKKLKEMQKAYSCIQETLASIDPQDSKSDGLQKDAV